MNVVSQGARPNYQSSIAPLSYKKTLSTEEHESFIGSAVSDLSEVTERTSIHPIFMHALTSRCCIVDFEQPRALWQKVFSKDAQDRYIKNVAGHLGNAKSAEIKARQRTFTLLLP